MSVSVVGFEDTRAKRRAMNKPMKVDMLKVVFFSRVFLAATCWQQQPAAESTGD
jgi:hypothetical protein